MLECQLPSEQLILEKASKSGNVLYDQVSQVTDHQFHQFYLSRGAALLHTVKGTTQKHGHQEAGSWGPSWGYLTKYRLGMEPKYLFLRS